MPPLSVPGQQALEWLTRGFAPIPVPYGSKRPVIDAWPDLRVSGTDLAEHFNGARQNVGVLLGTASDGRVCVDLDCAEAVALAPLFLPPTGLVHGRPKNPRSHWFYRVTGTVPSTARFDDPVMRSLPKAERRKARIIELLCTGTQVVVAGQHPSGEDYRLDEDGPPAAVDGDELVERVHRLAAGALLARYWPPEGQRHDASLALAGGLLRGGWNVTDAAHFIGAVAQAAGDEEAHSRARNVVSTAQRLATEGKATGWPTLVQIIDVGIVNQVRDWLGLHAEPTVTVLPTDTPWPAALAEEAYHGLAGAIVRAITPYSEADPAALFAHLFTGIGALLGPHVHALAGDAQHPARINVVCVGETSKGRKGSAQRPIERLLECVDDTFVPSRTAEGLSSGEGLIWEVRDPITRLERIGKGVERRTEEVEVDPGISDKRLWIVESEFATTLKVIQREGNTLSAVARRAWDSGRLKSMTKNSPAVATGAHICITGHVTKDELLRYLDRTELASGFANRFLWFAVRRARELPDGEEVPAAVLNPLVGRLRAVLEWARTPRLLRRDAEASALWHKVYGPLSAGRPGLLGGATNRAEAQVLRLSVFYAILDRAEAIRAEHLLAALAIWEYCEGSARWIFGDATGDPTADTILGALRRSGEMTRDDLVNLFDRHANRARIERALGLLLAAGFVWREMRATGGRPAEVWHAR
jgi:hypothetical protein